MEAQVDHALTDLENHATKHFSGGASTSFVTREAVEIDLLALVDVVVKLVKQLVRDDSRRAEMVCLLGAPYVRMARIRYILETVSLSEKRTVDRRWLELGESCNVAEAVLRDVDGARFRDWHELKHEGAFTPAFAEPDREVDSDDESEVAYITSERMAKIEPGGDSFPSHYGPKSSTEAAPSEQKGGMRFAESPCGPEAQISTEGRLLMRASGLHDSGVAEDFLDGLGNFSKEAGFSTKIGRSVLYHTRKIVASSSDDGGTAMSASPLCKFSNVGQYGEVAIQTVNDAPIGCLGIGVTRLGPSMWQKSKVPFPRRFDRFPGPSWIFTGPYVSSSRSSFYVHGKRDYRYVLSGDMSRWQAGDRIGILVRPGGELGLYLNRSHVLTRRANGLERLDVGNVDLWLVVECYGYVLEVGLEPHLDPSSAPHLNIPGMSIAGEVVPCDARPRMQTLDDFLS